jgi:O-acetylhomoserine (thiol)-lyase
MTDRKMREYGFEPLAYPAATTRSQLSADEQNSTGVARDCVRLSVGLAAVDDMLYDLDQALSGA